jgi:hypothetical protein
VDRYSEPFPSGNVEDKLGNAIEVLILAKNGIWGNLRFDFTDINNVGNISGLDKKIWEIRMNVGIKLPPISREL